MQTKLRVKRYDPEGPEPASSVQEYDLEVPEHYTVLDALIKVREEVDPSLALRCSCRASICGIVCDDGERYGASGVQDEAAGRGARRPAGERRADAEPAGRQGPGGRPTALLGKIRAVEPYLQPKGPEPEDEYIAPNDAMLNLLPAMGCIMCGACVSACTVLEVDSNFLGPAALAKAYRFVADPAIRRTISERRHCRIRAGSGIARGATTA